MTPRNASPDESNEASRPAWRQPPPVRRTKVRRSQIGLPRAIWAGVRHAGRRVIGAFAQVRKIRPRWYWAMVPLLALVGYAVSLLFTSYEFYVYEAEIVGNQRVPTEAIYAASNIDKKNIFWVQPRVVARRIEAVPGIARARVSVRPPNYVRIEVIERVPLLVWQTKDQTEWIADDGVTVPMTGEAPALTLIDDNRSAGDTKGNLRPQVLSDLQTLRNLRPDLAQVRYGAAEGLYFRATDGWAVYLGVGGNMAKKLTLLESMRPRMMVEKTKPTMVDLRVDGEAYYR